MANAQQYRQGAPMAQQPGQQMRFPAGQISGAMQPRPGMPYPNQAGANFAPGATQMPASVEQTFPK